MEDRYTSIAAVGGEVKQHLKMKGETQTTGATKTAG